MNINLCCDKCFSYPELFNIKYLHFNCVCENIKFKTYPDFDNLSINIGSKTYIELHLGKSKDEISFIYDNEINRKLVFDHSIFNNPMFQNLKIKEFCILISKFLSNLEFL